MPIGACPVAPGYTVSDARTDRRGSHCSDTCKTQPRVIRASESTGYDTEGLQPARSKGGMEIVSHTGPRITSLEKGSSVLVAEIMKGR